MKKRIIEYNAPLYKDGRSISASSLTLDLSIISEMMKHKRIRFKEEHYLMILFGGSQ